MKILIFGASGLVGSKFIEIFDKEFEIHSPLATEIDILDFEKLSKKVSDFKPDAIINFAAYTNVEEAEKDKGNEDSVSYKVNVKGAKNVADACKQFDKYLIHISTEYVFDGRKENFPYTEDDEPNPINWYGETKYIGEMKVLESGSRFALVRISMPYSAKYELKKDIARNFLEQLQNGNQIRVISDQRITPTLVDDIANALSVILKNQKMGIYHVCSRDSVTPLEFAKTIARCFKLDYSLISETTLDEYNKNKKGKLLRNSTLNPAKFEKEFGDDILHTVEEGLIIFKEELTKIS